MTEIPEHLLKRAQAARDKAAGEGRRRHAAGSEAAGRRRRKPPPRRPATESRIPAHLLERPRPPRPAPAAATRRRGRRRRRRRAGPVASVVQAPPAAAGVPIGAGPGATPNAC